jgi:hypothetical protein
MSHTNEGIKDMIPALSNVDTPSLYKFETNIKDLLEINDENMFINN